MIIDTDADVAPDSQIADLRAERRLFASVALSGRGTVQSLSRSAGPLPNRAGLWVSRRNRRDRHPDTIAAMLIFRGITFAGTRDCMGNSAFA